MRKKSGAPHPGVIISEERDIPLLLFLWKWKLATTAALAQRFYSTISGEGAYRRLWRLERMGLIAEKVGRTHRCCLWTLGEKGFRLIRPYLPDLREEGFRSEAVGHDILTGAVHLGDWLTEQPADVKLFSEQELRRYELSAYPEWVPRDDAHRADGYWNLPGDKGRRTIALEVELSRQREARHVGIADFYRRNRKIVRVLWLVMRGSSAKILNARLDDGWAASDPSEGKSFHDFALVGDVIEQGWGAKVILGPEVGQPIRQLVINQQPTSCPPVDRLPMLDTRKSPHRSGKYHALSKAELGV